MKRSPQFRSPAGFTLVELLVSTAIIALIMVVMLQMVNHTTQTWQYTTEKIEKFQKARDGFESMTRRLSQATLNTSWDYLGVIPPGTAVVARPTDIATNDYKNFVPLYYGRSSNLRFISGPMKGTGAIVTGSAGSRNWLNHGIFFQAPFGMIEDTPTNQTEFGSKYGNMDNLLNTWGFFLEVSDADDRPSFIDEAIAPKRWRSRLMEFMQPAENMILNDPALATDLSTNWFSKSLLGTTPPMRTLAENVVALAILPKLSKQDEEFRKSKNYFVNLAPDFIYDSTKTLNPGVPASPGEFGGINPHHQLPPVVQVVMIAIDERSAARLEDKYQKDPKLGLGQAATKAGVDYNNLFTDAAKLDVVPASDGSGGFTTGQSDLYDFEKILVSEKVSYRIFSTNVTIRGAKWSRSSKF